MRTKQSLCYPHCLGIKVVKNGRKKNSAQTYRCRTCGKQFQEEYLYWGARKKNKELVFKMLRGKSGITDIADILTTSMDCVLRVLLSYADVEWN